MPRLVGRWTRGLGVLGAEGLSADHLFVGLAPWVLIYPEIAVL